MITVLVALLVGVAVSTIANLCTTVYLHRGLSHRAIRFSRPLDAAFKTLVWLTTGIKVREWVAVHRKHHAHTDTPDDPHSPAISGWRTVQLKNLVMYRRAAHDRDNIDRYAKDLARRPPTGTSSTTRGSGSLCAPSGSAWLSAGRSVCWPW